MYSSNGKIAGTVGCLCQFVGRNWMVLQLHIHCLSPECLIETGFCKNVSYFKGFCVVQDLQEKWVWTRTAL